MRLFRATDDYETLWHMDATALTQLGLRSKGVEQFLSWRKDQNPLHLYTEATAHDTQIIICTDDRYPQLLHTIHDPPPLLFVRGQLPPTQQAIAIVGSRNVSADGKRATELFSRACVQAAVPVVSGLAEGVDTIAHEATLEAQGITIGVLACGLDAIPGYDRRVLAKRICMQGAIISELPGNTPAASFRFPIRNRLVAGMSRATLVIEAAHKSGSLITAKAALEAGRDVYAVPGSIFNTQADGTNALLKDGALFATVPSDLFPTIATNIKEPERLPTNLSAEELMIVQLLHRPKNSADICDNLSFPPAKILALLTSLTLRGVIFERDGVYYDREFS